MAMDTDGYHFKVDLPPAPADMIIPVTKSCDAKFTIDRVVIGRDGEKVPVNFNSDEVFLSIDRGGETFRVDATIDANQAMFVIDSSICDSVRGWDRWRAVVLHGLSENALAVGSFERHDGGT
jgi:hypothetical protein